MKKLLSFVAALLALTLPLHAGIIRVPGDYATIPEAVHYGTADDTVVVGTGVYAVEPGSPFGWPIDLGPDSPTIMSEDQVSKTVLEGDGTIPAFRVAAPGPDARIRIIGFTIRSVSSPLLKGEGCGGRFLFTNNNVQNCGDGLDASWSSGLIARSVIWDNDGIGIDVSHFSGTIEFDEVAYNTWGIWGTAGESPTIRMSWIHRNSLGGIRTGSDASIDHNVIHKNGGPGILEAAVSGRITGNTISENAVGISVSTPTSAVIRENGIYGNAPYDVRVEADGRYDVDMTMNWWGTTYPDLISERIWDCHDDPELESCIVFEPFCTDPGCAPTLAEPLSWGAIKTMFR